MSAELASGDRSDEEPESRDGPVLPDDSAASLRSLDEEKLDVLTRFDEYRGARLREHDGEHSDPTLVRDSFAILARINSEVAALKALPLGSHSTIELLDAGAQRRELLANQLRVHHAKDLTDALLAHEANAIQSAQEQAAAIRHRRTQQALEKRAESEEALAKTRQAVIDADAEVARLREVAARAPEGSQEEFTAAEALPGAELDARAKRIDVEIYEGMKSFSEADIGVADVLDVGWQGIASNIADIRAKAAGRQLRSRHLRRLRFLGYAAVLLIVEFIVGELTDAHFSGAVSSALILAILERVWVNKALERREQKRQRQELIFELTLHLLLWLDLRFLEAALSRYAGQHDVPVTTFVPMELFADAPSDPH
jgi:hypothetical protein